LGIRKVLPETGNTLIELPAQAKGTLRFSCSMGMARGQILFE
jgi:plastocyanin domain-containing protein